MDLPAVGVKFLESIEGFEDLEPYDGVSYCDAVRLATSGYEQLIVPGSIDTCRWSPVVLGLKGTETAFEQGLEPRLEGPVAGVYLAPLSGFRAGLEPDVVIIRGRPEQLRRITATLPSGSLQARYRGRIGWTALGVGDATLSARVLLTHTANRLLAVLKRWKRFDDLTRTLFRSERVTGTFERMLRNTMADMSVCRNSSILPHLEDAANISYFCTGGVTWGGNSPAHMTCGMPYRLYREIEGRLSYPGK
ncbi:MAG: DUF169 domain-containing protein [Actinobacteria bacterium]|nr:DUF169 domain-containing protein [Actinomycetota bacterium]MBU2687719.1 DUF169 domain-containing protein [Actinomycetota bacterium]